MTTMIKKIHCLMVLAVLMLLSITIGCSPSLIGNSVSSSSGSDSPGDTPALVSQVKGTAR